MHQIKKKFHQNFKITSNGQLIYWKGGAKRPKNLVF